jgi:superfamily II DNA or RNA helicase
VIVIKSLNETHLKLDCEDNIANKLNEYFSFYGKGYQYDWRYKTGKWSGRFYLFSLTKRTILKGLLNEILGFCDKNLYPYRLLFDNSEVAFSFIEAKAFIKTLNLPYELHDFQLNAFIRCVQTGRCVNLMSTSSGKSLVMYVVSRYFNNKKQLIIVPTVGLVHQLASDFDSYGGIQQGISKIYSGEPVIGLRNVTIAVWRSISNIEDSNWINQWDIISGDEVHTFTAKSLVSIMNGATKAPQRYGWTGSIGTTKINEMLLTGLFGPIKRLVSSKELMDTGKAAVLTIKILELVHSQSDRVDWSVRAGKSKNLVRYRKEIDFVINHEVRNRFITNLALSLKGNTMILFRLVSHGQALYKIITEKADSNRKVFYVDGGVDGEFRDDIRGFVDQEDNSIIVASIKTFGTGVNIPRLNNVIAAHPMKGEIDLVQCIGRSLRLAHDKYSATFFDIADDLSDVERDNSGLRQMDSRIAIYRREKFHFNKYKIKLEGS